ncbi:hypothetical protein SACE_1942 [Saccharopolyspora erythraea NRRL 2338]|uniref:Uncharacterized protein n=1 Tax=Saccharopolyspora erythraea (strain ATCC 11635 / DSM 40517 / JCM 4748 / NBRC 13426 / NCIMB 8594 / NRRL 2338) TaxID=405948 RepID=A4FB28_SACEN|nr:hypothetical protein SACE_1942 [Saccharopolyspora erythraea NRRL 2338]
MVGGTADAARTPRVPGEPRFAQDNPGYSEDA